MILGKFSRAPPKLAILAWPSSRHFYMLLYVLYLRYLHFYLFIFTTSVTSSGELVSRRII